MGEIDGQIERTRGALQDLRERAAGTQNLALSEAVEELSNTLEELEVASEELVEQNEELRATQDELAGQRQAYQELFDFAPNAYLVTDAYGIIRQANREAARLLRESRPGLKGRPLASFVSPEARAAFRRQLNRTTVRSAHGWEIPLTVRDHDELIVWVDVEPTQETAGEAKELRWMLRDVTAVRRAQRTLQARFAATTQEAERLVDLDRWKDAFLAAAAHDLRSPLVMIDAAAQNILHAVGEEPDAVIEQAHWVRSCVERMDRLLLDLLDLDRFTRGAVHAQREPTDVAELLERVIESSDLDDHPVHVVADPIRVLLDGPRVEQLVGNLVRNAVVHTPPGTPIHLRAELDGEVVVLIVEDEGPGVPDGVRDSLFQPFVTTAAHPTDTGGTGIGLSLVHLFAELHGGSVVVEQSPRGGARFVVNLPSVAAPASSDPVQVIVSGDHQHLDAEAK